MKPVQIILNQAKQIAREESNEFLKSAKGQVVTQPEQKNSQPQEENKPEEQKVSGPSPADLLEKDMERYRQLRRERDEEIKKQKELESQEQLKPQTEPVMAPSSKPKGPLRGMKAKLQKLQMGGEARVSKGKD